MERYQLGQAVWRRRSWVLGVFATTVLASGWALFGVPPVYQATSKVLLEYEDPTEPVLSGATRRAAPSRTAAQLEVARSPAIVSRVIKQNALRDAGTRAALTIDQFLRRSELTNVPGTDVLAFTHRDADPKLARRVADSWAQIYIQENGASGKRAAIAQTQLLHDQLKDARQALSQAETTLAAYQRSEAMIDPGEAARASALTRGSLESALWESTAYHDESTARLNALQQQLDEQNGAVTDLAVDRASLTNDYMRAQVAAVGYMSRKETLQRLLDGFQTRLTALPDKERQLTQFKRQVVLAGDRVRLVQRHLDAARLKSAMHASDAKLIAGAVAPEKPDPRGRLLWLLALAMAGLGLGVGVALLRDATDGTLKSLAEAEEALELPVLGIVPRLRGSDHAGLVTLRRPGARASDAFRTLRTRLGHLETPLQVLAVTSAGPGEGASAAIANLAVCTAQLGYQVLLIDADMRHPTLHLRFGKPNGRGLSSVLTGDCRLGRAVQSGPVENLSLLAAGPMPENPADWLASSRLSALIAAAREQYDLILIDVPPVLAAPDATILAERMDGVVFVVGMHRATAEGARLAVQHLEASKGNVLGMVLSGLQAGLGRHAREAPPSDPGNAEPAQALIALPAPRQG